MENLSKSIIKLAEIGYPEEEIKKICGLIFDLELKDVEIRIENIIKENFLVRKDEYLERV